MRGMLSRARGRRANERHDKQKQHDRERVEHRYGGGQTDALIAVAQALRVQTRTSSRR